MKRDQKMLIYGKARRVLEEYGEAFLCTMKGRIPGLRYQSDGLSITGIPLDEGAFIDYHLTVIDRGNPVLEGSLHGELVVREDEGCLEKLGGLAIKGSPKESHRNQGDETPL